MSTLTNIPLPQATKWAEGIVAELAPFCDRIEIAGSIRRRRPFVNDVDLVVLIKRGLEKEFRNRVTRTARVIKDGPQNFIVGLSNGLRLDIFIARHPQKDLFRTNQGNFGTLLICRTGSKEHNIWLVNHAKINGLQWKPYDGVCDEEGNVLTGEDERACFTALGLDWIEPERRER